MQLAKRACLLTVGFVLAVLAGRVAMKYMGDTDASSSHDSHVAAKQSPTNPASLIPGLDNKSPKRHTSGLTDALLPEPQGSTPWEPPSGTFEKYVRDLAQSSAPDFDWIELLDMFVVRLDKLTPVETAHYIHFLTRDLPNNDFSTVTLAQSMRIKMDDESAQLAMQYATDAAGDSEAAVMLSGLAGVADVRYGDFDREELATCAFDIAKARSNDTVRIRCEVVIARAQQIPIIDDFVEWSFANRPIQQTSRFMEMVQDVLAHDVTRAKGTRREFSEEDFARGDFVDLHEEFAELLIQQYLTGNSPAVDVARGLARINAHTELNEFVDRGGWPADTQEALAKVVGRSVVTQDKRKRVAEAKQKGH